MTPATLLLTWTLAAGPPALAGSRAEGLAGLALRQLAQARVGDWVSYRYERGAAAPQGFWRVAVVGEEKDRQGREALWVEVEFGPHEAMRAPLLQLRLLVARDVEAADAVSRLVVALGSERPREVGPVALAELTVPRPPEPGVARRPPAHRGRVRHGHPAPLVTPAGTLTARPVELMDRTVVLQRIWMSEGIPVLRMARVELPLIEHVMVVNAFGHDAAPRMVLPAPGVATLEVTPVESIPWLVGGLAGLPGEAAP